MTFYRAIFDFIERYRSLFLNPSGNSIEILLSTAMIVIGAIILWMAGSILFRSSGGWLRRIRLFKRPWLVLSLIVGGIAATAFVTVGGTYALTTNPSFCGRVCHSMNPAFQSWRVSDHRDVACVDCHLKDASIASLGERIDLVLHGIEPELAGSVSSPINSQNKYARTQVPDSVCRRCHPASKAIAPERFNLRVEHEEHVAQGLKCVTCHNRVGHPEAEKFSPLREREDEFKYQDFISMDDGCLRCHEEGGEYVDDEGEKIIGPYRLADGSTVSIGCRSCHPQQQLVKLQEDIKKVRARHFEDPPWKDGIIHGERARKVDFKPCKVCHNPAKRCTVCHQGITMPHQDDWIDPAQHGAKARAVNIKPCKMCHTVGTVPRCAGDGHHHEPFIAEYKFDIDEVDWKVGKERHGVVAKATGGTPCYRCHERETWCATQCHQGIAMPHRSDWRNVHFTYVELEEGIGWRRERWQREDVACPMCHNKGGRPKDYCNNCHHQRFGAQGLLTLMKNMKNTYGVTPELSGATRLPCEDCHVHEGLEFCRSCHRSQGVIPGG